MTKLTKKERAERIVRYAKIAERLINDREFLKRFTETNIETTTKEHKITVAEAKNLIHYANLFGSD